MSDIKRRKVRFCSKATHPRRSSRKTPGCSINNPLRSILKSSKQLDEIDDEDRLSSSESPSPPPGSPENLVHEINTKDNSIPLSNNQSDSVVSEDNKTDKTEYSSSAKNKTKPDLNISETLSVVNTGDHSNILELDKLSTETRKSVPETKSKNNKNCKMSGLINDFQSMSRLQEKSELQQLNDRFTNYIHYIRQIRDNTNQVDSSAFLSSIQVLEEEIVRMKNMYEAELARTRAQVDDLNREKSYYQMQTNKHQTSALQLQDQVTVETDKIRKLNDKLNELHRTIALKENEIIEARRAIHGPVGDLEQVQRDYLNVVRENQDLKRRYEREQVQRQEAEEKVHSLQQKLEFEHQVNYQQSTDLRDRLETSANTILQLEAKIREMSKQLSDNSLVDMLQRVRETAQIELERYKADAEEAYNRNLMSMKHQMDQDSRSFESMAMENKRLQGEVDELQAKVRNLNGQIVQLDNQRRNLEEIIDMERVKAAQQIQTLEKKFRELNDALFTKMRELNASRDAQIPLKAEIESLKSMMEDEERRLKLPLNLPPKPTVLPLSNPTPRSIPLANMPPPLQPLAHVSPSPLPPVTPPPAVSSAPVTVPPPITTPITTTPLASQYIAPVTTPLPAAATPSAIQPVPTSLTTTEPLQSQYNPVPEYRACSPNLNTLNLSLVDTNPPITVDPLPSQFMDEMERQEEEVYHHRTPTPPREPSPKILGPVGPIRVRSAPATSRSKVHMVPTYLGQGKDYFDEMFQDLKVDTLQNRPSSMDNKHRPYSSVQFDYTTSTSSATGPMKILEVNQDGKYVRIINTSPTNDEQIGGFMIQQNVGGHPVAVYRFPPRTTLKANSTTTVHAGCNDPILHQPPTDFVWKEQERWGTGPECTTILCKPNGQAIAWTTAAHRFTRNAFNESSAGSTANQQEELSDSDGEPYQEEPRLSALETDVNAEKPDPVFLRREKTSPPTLFAQKHPHGTQTANHAHPQVGQARPRTMGNDNSTKSRQSRSQTSRPDPVAGQPYAGAAAQRMGSAPLRRYTPPNSATVRGSGAIANKSAGTIRFGPPTPFLSPLQQEFSSAYQNKSTSLIHLTPGVTTSPPSPFQTPRNKFAQGLQQIQSQHDHDHNPPMPRPPLFSSW